MCFETIEALYVFEYDLILHGGVQHDQAPRGWSEINGTFIVLILTEHQLNLLTIMKTL